MIKKIVTLLISSIENGTLFRDLYHILRYKKFSYKDFIVKYKKFSFQKKITKKVKKFGINFFYSDEYLLNGTQYNDIDSFVDNIMLKRNNFLPENMFQLDEKKIINNADKFCEHYFNLLGSGEVKVCYGMKASGLEGVIYEAKEGIAGISNFVPSNYKLIDWSIDIKSGYRWDEDTFYGDILSFNNLKGVDIKVPWELSRCQHLTILAQAYKLTGNQKYSNEIKYQIIDWINNNKFGYGPNWVCAMDVGIRVSNWLVAIELIKDSNVLNDKNFLKMLSISIYHHHDYLLNNLEWNSNLTSNHYLSDIVGIFFVSNYFPHFKDSLKTKIKFKKEIEKEIFKQTYEDGMDFEGSTNYHRLVLELFAYSALIDLKEGNFSKDFNTRLFKMFQFSAKTIKKDGKAPQIGDNDSGIFLNLANKNLADHSYLSDLAQKIFSKKDIKILNKNYKETYSSFKNAGIHIFRNDDIYFLLSNGPNGQNGNGGHSHNDKLSFILDYKENNLLIDPGTYLYTPFPDMRNLFRSTSSHNTVMIDEKEQNQFIKNYLFGMVENCTSMNSSFSVTDDGFVYRGSHNGYERIGKDLIHKREIEYSKSKNMLKVIDSFKDSKMKKNLYLIVPRKVFKGIKNNQLHLNEGKIQFHNFTSISKKDFFNSEAYGLKRKDAVQISVSFNKSIETLINLN